MARIPVVAPITGPSGARTMSIPALVDNINATMIQTYTDFPVGATGPQGPIGPQGPAGTAASLATTNLATGTAGSLVAYNAGTNTLTIPRGDTGATGPTGPQGPPGTGGGSADAGAIENASFGTAVMSQFPSLTPPSQAQMTANRTALINALAWSASTGGVVQLGYGILYIWGAVELPLGASINGKGMDASRIQQGQLPQDASTPWLDVLTSPAVVERDNNAVPPVVHSGGNGYNNITNLTIDGGWNRRSYVGDTADVWAYPANRMTATGIRIHTPLAGTGSDAAFRTAGSDAHVRLKNVLIQNVAGPGFWCSGRGENFFLNMEIRLCHKSFYLAAPDCWIHGMTSYTIGDLGAELRAGAGNLRFDLSKLWFIGMVNSYEPIGAGIYIPDAGTYGITMNQVDTQDTFGAGLHMSGDSNITYEGFIDEAAGGRLEAQIPALGWKGARTRHRAFIHIDGTCRRAKIKAQIRGGGRNGTGNYPYLLNFTGSAHEFNDIRFEGPLTSINMATATLSGATAANGVVVANGLTNANKYNEVWHGFRLIYGAMTEAMLNNAAHQVNDANYGPSEVTMVSGVKASRRNAGLIGWNLHRAVYILTDAEFTALSTAEQNATDRVYIVTE